MRCFVCKTDVEAEVFAAHARLLHVGGSGLGWQCGECQYQTSSLDSAVAHCVAHAHNPELLATRQPLGLLSFVHKAQIVEAARRTDGQPPLPPLPTAARKSITAPPASPPAHGSSSSPLSTPRMKVEPGDVTSSTRRSKRARHASARAAAVSQTSPPPPLMIDESLEEGKVACAVCGAVLKRHKSNVYCHIIACTKVKPYSCTACGLLGGRKANVLEHTRRVDRCREEGATVVLANKEEDTATVAEAFQTCFPGHDWAWNGFSEVAKTE